MTKNNAAVVRERREHIHSLLAKGMKGYEIAKELNVDPSTISRDIQYLTRQYSDSLSLLAKETMPFITNCTRWYSRCAKGMLDHL